MGLLRSRFTLDTVKKIYFKSIENIKNINNIYNI